MEPKERTPWQPSSKATLRVKDPAPVQTTCHRCGGEVVIVNNSEIYGEEYGKWPWVYLCRGCRSYVGMHQAFFYLPYEDGVVLQGGVSSRQTGAIPVIAAMRTIVTHYIGYEIYLPDELELLK